jgi:hypothetical protein
MLPEMDIVVEGVGGNQVDFDVTFTFDGNEKCTTTVTFPGCQPTPSEKKTWGRIKSRFK